MLKYTTPKIMITNKTAFETNFRLYYPLLSHTPTEVYSLNPAGLWGIDPSGLEPFLVGD